MHLSDFHKYGSGEGWLASQDLDLYLRTSFEFRRREMTGKVWKPVRPWDNGRVWSETDILNLAAVLRPLILDRNLRI